MWCGRGVGERGRDVSVLQKRKSEGKRVAVQQSGAVGDRGLAEGRSMVSSNLGQVNEEENCACSCGGRGLPGLYLTDHLTRQRQL